MALTAKGFERQSYDDILNKEIQRAKELFGEDIDTSELTPLGKFIRIGAYYLAEAEEEAEYIYYSIFPNTARGVSLDRLCVFVGITRDPATASIYKIKVYGTDGYIVPMGFLVGTVSGITFYSIEEKEIIGGECEITVWCTETGTIGNVDMQDITKIVNPVAEVKSIECIEYVAPGAEDETDYELRKRFEAAREGAGACTEASIKAAVMRVPTVTSVSVIVNDTLQEDGDGRPGKSFECYINGGDNYHELIGETIFEKTPIGIKTVGDVSVVIKDEFGREHTVNFSHTTKLSVYVKLKIRIEQQYEGENGKAAIIDNLKTFINNLGVGEDVILSSLYGKVHAVMGVEEVTELLLSEDNNNYLPQNINVEEWEVANCVDVIVEVVN